MLSRVARFAEFELDSGRYQLRRGDRVLKLEKIPMELLILLAESNGQLVTRDQIIERIWGKGVFLDTEHGINTAIRNIRQALGDDSEQPRFVQTVTGKGYRFIRLNTLEAKPVGISPEQIHWFRFQVESAISRGELRSGIYPRAIVVRKPFRKAELARAIDMALSAAGS